jgi:predicted DNA-binding transcriptional regulator AlpA
LAEKRLQQAILSHATDPTPPPAIDPAPTTNADQNPPHATGGHPSMTAPTSARRSPTNNDLLTLAEVLDELDVPKSTFFRWKAIGKAPRTIKYPNGSLRIRRRDLDAWLKTHEENAAA